MTVPANYGTEYSKVIRDKMKYISIKALNICVSGNTLFRVTCDNTTKIS